MPSVNWQEVFANKAASLKTIWIASFRSLTAILSRGFVRSPLSLGNEVRRAWLGIIFGLVPTALYSEPNGHGIPLVKEESFETYVVPPTPAGELGAADVIVVFTHGGGMIMGHPLQYLVDYQRWIKRLEGKGKKTIFVAPKYPLSSTGAKWPAQREAVVATYEWLLSQGVPASKIVFAGDSAGGNLAILSMLQLRETKRSQPACAIIMSAWLDMHASETVNSPHVRSDFMLAYDIGVPLMNDALRPVGTKPDTPEISALLWTDVGRLAPQLVMYSSTEILGSDSERWIRRSKAAGVDITEYAREGEMHTFSVGWPICAKKVQDECDEIICSYIVQHIT